jgi:hypothetical protein
MTHIGYPTLPEKYILKRWTKNARTEYSSIDSLLNEMDVAASRTHRHNLLFHACMDLSSKGNISIDAFHIAMKNITEALQKIHLTCTPEEPTSVPEVIPNSTNLSAESEEESSNGDEEDDDMEAELHDAVLPPDRRKKRGRPRSSRYKKQIEGGVRKKRTCSYCKQKGHYRTGCPDNPENATRSKVDKVCKKCKLPGHNSTTCGNL